jgi:hypothetical protein
MNKFIPLYLLLLISITKVLGQNNRRILCGGCSNSNQIISASNGSEPKIRSSYMKDSLGIYFNIENNSLDTIYIFNSYFEKEFLSSPYLHRVDKRNKINKISFLPLVPYISTRYDDVITKERLLSHNQIVYDFYRLPPRTKIEFGFLINDLFKMYPKRKNCILDFDAKKLHKYSKNIPLKFCECNGDKYELIQFEFAIYKKVNLLCNQNSFYSDEYEFDRQSKSFEILSISIPDLVKKSY